jgi:uncharacterized DUF497 family protein
LPAIFELRPGEEAEDHLWSHGLYLEDVYSVLDENRYKVFPDANSSERAKIIGPDRGGRLLTVVVQRPDQDGIAFIITGWPADRGEATLYSRPGGTRYA